MSIKVLNIDGLLITKPMTGRRIFWIS